MKRKTIFALMAIMILSPLTGCKSLKPKDYTNETAVKNTENDKKGFNAEDWVNNESDKQAPPLSDDLMKKTLKMEVVDSYIIGKDNIDLPKYNTMFGTRPYNTVYVVNITGNPYVKNRVYNLQGFIGDERLTFDSHQFSGQKDSEIFVLVFPYPLAREAFNSYNFKATVEGDKGNLVIDLKPTEGEVVHNNEQRAGGIYKVDDKSFAMWYNDNYLTKLSDSLSSSTFKFDYKLLAFGEDININKSDIKAYVEIDGNKEEIPADLIKITSEAGEDIEKVDKTGIFNVSYIKEFSKGELQRNIVFTLLEVKKSDPMRIEVYKK